MFEWTSFTDTTQQQSIEEKEEEFNNVVCLHVFFLSYVINLLFKLNSFLRVFKLLLLVYCNLKIPLVFCVVQNFFLIICL